MKQRKLERSARGHTRKRRKTGRLSKRTLKETLGWESHKCSPQKSSFLADMPENVGGRATPAEIHSTEKRAERPVCARGNAQLSAKEGPETIAIAFEPTVTARSQPQERDAQGRGRRRRARSVGRGAQGLSPGHGAHSQGEWRTKQGFTS